MPRASRVHLHGGSAAVYRQHGAVYEACAVGSEIDDCISDLLRGASPDGQRAAMAAKLREAVPHAGRSVGARWPRTHGVHAYTLRAKFGSPGFRGVNLSAALLEPYSAIPAMPKSPTILLTLTIAPLPCCSHFRRQLGDKNERRPYVSRIDIVKRVEGCFGRGSDRENAGIIHEDIDAVRQYRSASRQVSLRRFGIVQLRLQKGRLPRCWP